MSTEVENHNHPTESGSIYSEIPGIYLESWTMAKLHLIKEKHVVWYDGFTWATHSFFRAQLKYHLPTESFPEP